jgi:serine phosphatase RsbU (regulator of sigma subunit)
VQAANLQVQAQEALETNDDLPLLTTLRGLRSMDDFLSATVLHPDGTVFAHSDVRRVGQSIALPESVAGLASGQFFREVRDADHTQRIEVWAPVMSTLSGKPERIGIVCLGVSKAPLLAAVGQAKLAAIRLGVLFTLLALVGTALITRTVTQPISRLVLGVQRIAAGDLGHKVNLRRSDEIGLLSASFDRMTDELQQAQQELLKQRLYEKELEVAGKIQAALLPAGPPAVRGFDVAALSVPARVVGGDFYDYLPLRDGRTAFLVADVAGKGVSAGLVMAAARSATRSAFGFTTSPRAALTALNEQILRDFDRSTFVTMLCMVLDPERRTLAVANAGHPHPLWYRARADAVELIRLRGVALGILPEEKFASLIEESTVQLAADDVVLGYSDGVNETHDQQGSMFGDERLQHFVRAHGRLGAQSFLTMLRGELEHFSQGCGQFDDITALALRAALAADADVADAGAVHAAATAKGGPDGLLP